MPKRVLAIGVGGSGKAALTILKERLEEAYGRVPDTVALLVLDTDDLREVDGFAGTKLNPSTDERGRASEFQHVVTPQGLTMDTVFADMADGRTLPYMYWLEKEKLERILTQTEKDIRGGAQQRRPIGRTALFQRWNAPVFTAIEDGIRRIYGEVEDEERPVDQIEYEQSKRLIFIVGSVAGGTGSGFFLDVANLVRHAVQSNSDWQSIDVSGIIVLPDAFSSFAPSMDDPTNLKPNSFAALREMDRFNRVHDNNSPYMIRYGSSIASITWSTNQPMDHVYLVDTASRSSAAEVVLSGNPMRGIFPVIADFVMAHVDESLGDSLATLRSNAGLHYDRDEGWIYSSFNVMSYVFPVDDVIESFSYRFLREMLARQFLPPTEKRARADLEQRAEKEMERVFRQTNVANTANPGVIQTAITATRRVDPARPDVSWQGLFNLISLSDSAYAQDYEYLDQSLGYLSSNLTASGAGDYRSESYEEGYVRLTNFGEEFLDRYLGRQQDPDDEESRLGGEWDTVLSRYRDALRVRFAAALDGAILQSLNRRHPEHKLLESSSLPYARQLVAFLKSRLVRFRQQLEDEYRQLDIDRRVRETSEILRNNISWMQDTRYQRKPLFSFGKPQAVKAQEAYIVALLEKVELTLHQRMFRIVLDILDALGAADDDRDGRTSVVDQIAAELESWELTFRQVDRLVSQWSREHNENRRTKERIRVRRYLSDPEFEDELYQQPEHWGHVYPRVLGQVGRERGLNWRRREETEPLAYKLITTWGEEADGAEQIAQKFFSGVKELFQVVRQNVSVADRVSAEFASPSSLVNKVAQFDEPYLRYSPSENHKSMFHEYYLSFNAQGAQDKTRRFLREATETLREKGFNVDDRAESRVACTVVQVARGVKLQAVDQFLGCEGDYRQKLFRGRESIHLFPEEQVATDLEGRIEVLGETENRQRILAPQVVVAMRDELTMRAFTLACAYGLISDGTFEDPETQAETTEIMLGFNSNGMSRRLPLSQSQIVREIDPRFTAVAADEQLARLYLNALQNFSLKVLDKPGVQPGQVPNLVTSLTRRGVSLKGIENPFTLNVRDINGLINEKTAALGPDENEEPDSRMRDAQNARRRVEQHLHPFLRDKVLAFKKSPKPSIVDMGTVMHLILDEEIRNLNRKASAVSV